MKCIPVIFGINVNSKIPIFFGSFFKYVYYSYKNKWPLIAQEEYFIDPKYYEENFGIRLEEVFKINEIEDIDLDILNKVEKYIITAKQTDEVVKEFKDSENAWINLMNKKSKKLFNILDILFQDITKKHKDLKAIVVWRHNKTISEIAKKYNLKIIEMELSTIRKAAYNFGLSYFQFSNKYSSEELETRYKKFKKEIKDKKVPILSREEIINKFVNKSILERLDCTESYDFGVALGLQKDYETISTNSITNEEILEQIEKYKKDRNIIIRKHPANYNYKYKNEELFEIDASLSSLEYVSKCHRIVSSVSNINLEAMILGKTCYTLGKMPFKSFTNTSLEYDDEYIIDIETLNYIIFCYYVPYSLCLENEYIKFRLSNPSEVDIYMKHYNYLTKKELNKVEITRFSFKTIKEYTNEKIKKEELIKTKEELIKTKDEIINDLLVQYKDLENNYNNIINSKSWKITKPIRKIVEIIKKYL